MQLLNTNASNTKIMKTQTGTEYEIASLSLMPDGILCPSQIIAGCKEPCLVSSGRGQMHSVAKARQSKSDLWHNDQAQFLALLKKEMGAFIRRCEKRGKLAAFRLNTISDIPWEKHGIPQMFPTALLYQKQVRAAFKTDAPITVVFRGGFPDRYLGRPVIDGDKSDLVNLYAGPVVIGLKLKGGKAIQASTSPFIVDNPAAALPAYAIAAE